MEQLTLRVTGMHCGGCEHRVQKALARLEGVRRSSADHERGEVRVVFDLVRTSQEAVRASIERVGYGVEGVAGASGGSGAPGPAGASA